MSRRFIGAAGAAFALAFAAACSSNDPAPLAPATTSPAESGALSDGTSLKVTPPAPIAPASGAEVDDAEPVFSVGNAAPRFGAPVALEYRFEIQTEGGELVINSFKVSPGQEATSWEVPSPLEMGNYKWRARAEMGTNYGPWSDFVPFTITAPPSILPPGPYPTEPLAIAHFVQNAYPEYGRPGVSVSRRKEDMAFLRDRMIEVGLCVGLQWGRNLKRGGPEHSFDFLAWRTGGRTLGVDIAGSYDDTKRQLRLGFHVHGPGAFFDPLPNPEACRN
jgi:hypothetical protein